MGQVKGSDVVVYSESGVPVAQARVAIISWEDSGVTEWGEPVRVAKKSSNLIVIDLEKVEKIGKDKILRGYWYDLAILLDGEPGNTKTVFSRFYCNSDPGAGGDIEFKNNDC